MQGSCTQYAARTSKHRQWQSEKTMQSVSTCGTQFWTFQTSEMTTSKSWVQISEFWIFFLQKAVQINAFIGCFVYTKRYTSQTVLNNWKLLAKQTLAWSKAALDVIAWKLNKARSQNFTCTRTNSENPLTKTREINTARCMPGLNTYEVPFQLEASWEVTLESEAFPSLGGVALGQILPWEEGVVEEV